MPAAAMGKKHAFWETDPTADADGFRIEKGGEYGDWVAVTLVPGFIEAHSGIQSGSPVLMGTRLPAYVGMGWVLEYLLREDGGKGLRGNGLTREKAIALAAFDAGVEWQRNRGRRQRFKAKALELYRASPSHQRLTEALA